ncbi:MAG: hypothetical protein ACE5E7_11900 [Anaerolineae bacterium]
MTYGAGAGAAAAAAAVVQAVKASGAIVKMKPDGFTSLLERVEKPLIVMTTGGVFSKNYQYLLGYKGFVFYTKSAEKLSLPLEAELVTADKIWIPG